MDGSNENQPPELVGYNLYLQDLALTEAIHREGADWAESDLSKFGQLSGSSEMIELGFLANANRPVLRTHDEQGSRIDEVTFHPAYHQLMQTSMLHGLHASHWQSPGVGAQVARAARFYMMTQVEAAHGCPITMTSAALPALRNFPDLHQQLAPLLMSNQYDERNIPWYEKSSMTMGMAMTEKQGGSDVRSNTTQAIPVGLEDTLAIYKLSGDKHFVSAPMSDAFLVLAQAPEGLSCFFVPRWRPNGQRNAIHIQRLKDKMGNVANASSEVTFEEAYGIRLGEPGRGIRTIIDMVAMTRFDCMIGSSAGMRQATAQAMHYCHHRQAFGQRLTKQPLMQNVLADLALESEAALSLTMRVAAAMDRAEQDEYERLLVRLLTSVGKYWICKRTPGHAYEAMECLGGSGVMEDSILPRLFRESPVNAIWEGSGNIQCIDMLRAIKKTPEVMDVYFTEVEKAFGINSHFDKAIQKLKNTFSKNRDIEYRVRQIIEDMALIVQASLMLENSPAFMADAFCRSRLTGHSGRLYGGLPTGIESAAVIERARPKVD